MGGTPGQVMLHEKKNAGDEVKKWSNEIENHGVFQRGHRGRRRKRNDVAGISHPYIATGMHSRVAAYSRTRAVDRLAPLRPIDLPELTRMMGVV